MTIDMKQFRKHLVNQAPKKVLNEMSPLGRDLHDQIKYLPKLKNLKKMAEVVSDVWAHVQELSDKGGYSFRRKMPHLLSRLDELLDMLNSGRIDPSEIEILQTEILADLQKL